MEGLPPRSVLGRCWVPAAAGPLGGWAAVLPASAVVGPATAVRSMPVVGTSPVRRCAEGGFCCALAEAALEQGDGAVCRVDRAFPQQPVDNRPRGAVEDADATVAEYPIVEAHVACVSGSKVAIENIVKNGIIDDGSIDKVRALRRAKQTDIRTRRREAITTISELSCGTVKYLSHKEIEKHIGTRITLLGTTIDRTRQGVMVNHEPVVVHKVS